VGTFAELLTGTDLALGGAPASELLIRSWTADFGTARYAFAAPLGGLGLHWLPTLALATLGLGYVAAGARRRGSTATANLLAAVAIVVAAASILAVSPMPWWPRLTLFVLIASLALAAVALSWMPRRVAVVIAILIAIAATWSVGIATATSNVPIENRYRIWSFDMLGRLTLRGQAARSALGYWAQCRDFERIPPGALVAVDQLDLHRVTEGNQVRIVGYGFNLLHLIVGHNLEHRLAAPIAPTDDPAQLESRARAVGATYLVLASDGPSAPAARHAPAVFKSLGAACKGALAIPEAEIFELTSRA
jgi:hypothetical protein